MFLRWLKRFIGLDQGSSYRANLTCHLFYTACELRIIFTFLMVKKVFCDMRIIWKFSVSINKVLLEHYNSHLFMYYLWPLGTGEAELSNYSRDHMAFKVKNV